MSGKTIKIRSSEGAEFDCYLAPPQNEGRLPAVVLASAVHGVDADLREIADEFAARGFIAAAPDLFGAQFRGRSGATTIAPKSARSRGLKKSKPANATWPIPWRRSASCRNSTGAQRPWALLWRPLRHPRAEAPRLRRRHLLSRQSDARLHRRTRRRRCASLHYVGRPGQPSADRGARTPIAPWPQA